MKQMQTYMFLTQWAAVRTQELLTMEPLQIWLPQLMIMACQGMVYRREIRSAKAENNSKFSSPSLKVFILPSPAKLIIIIKIDLQTQSYILLP